MPCSIDRTPARRAALMPSAAWAWAITQRPAAAASVTRAVSSSSRKWAWRGSSVGDRTPPLVATLMTSAPGPDQLADLAPHGLGPVDQAVGHARVDRPELDRLPRREPAVAVAAGLAEQDHRDLQPRPGDQPVGHRLLDAGVGPGGVPDHGDAGGLGRPEVLDGLVEAVGERR